MAAQSLNTDVDMKDSVLRFDHAGYTYPGGYRALTDIDFDIRKGERVALVGLNGSGKSTLLLHAAGLLFATDGAVYFRNMKLTPADVDACRRSVGMVFQESDDQVFMPTVEADVAFGPKNMGLSDDEIDRRVDEALAMTGCTDLRKRAPFQLSGGQKKMVSIATVLSMSPDILVFDEPTTGLDYSARSQFIDIVSPLRHTLLIASHDMDLVRTLCTRALVMDGGRLVYDGPIENMPYPCNPSK